MPPDGSSSPLTESTFSGHRPAGAGDLSVESHGIAPIPAGQRYGSPARLFTVWFAPQVNVAGMFTGTLAIVLGLGFWLGVAAMVIGTILGALIVGYLSTWGPRTGTGQLPNSRMAFGGSVVVPGVLQWVSTVGWTGLVALFGGEALAELLGLPFWLSALIVLGTQGAIGFVGYELIHRIEAALALVLFVTFVVFAVKLVGGHQVITPPTVAGADLAGAFVLELTIAFSLAVSWASYASDFSRYLPVASSRLRVFGYTVAGLVLSYTFIQGIGIASAEAIGDHTAAGVRAVMGGGVMGAVALVVIVLASIGSGVMNAYSGSLALQTIGIRVKRPVSAVIVTALAFVLILWLQAADTAARFQDVVLLVSYWIPAFVAVVVIDWLLRIRGRASLNPAEEPTERRDAAVALIVFVVSYVAAVPFMHTSLYQGPIATAWHGADIAYFVNLVVAIVLYGGYRLLRRT